MYVPRIANYLNRDIHNSADYDWSESLKAASIIPHGTIRDAASQQLENGIYNSSHTVVPNVSWKMNGD